ncbi:MAG: Holliday junction ATP-dependent DNA helicase RuvA [Parcubacteria group bacterium GW2011_GWC1_42_11]|uniref:Holliday junction branch migration complex subunit RuvA n=1 Tax=Candidatus Nomurabacteria bacterium GW2011_GWC2_42_20 TaxID=1618756 RepID=A0A0G0ZEX7_9BACT|nr:MAG: Holliday junction ATP-dependent DNA helicase RuvA [Parcubacteria group bacterium GW2011_GWC1_42_11]KKS47224.1 MAG: Holliday junction ATP-dependent DNA helicase RuvA [Candidatus Nomurabacteria bacterium GW2011_GWC2_42_20]HBH71755.1 Holliday junction branch migration protein RuvA [Candidatus Yonathbacteria bacterium]
MIAHLSGTILFAGDRYVVIETNGVGYKVRLAVDTLQTLRKNTGENTSLWIHTAVREDALDLYGFQNQVELEFFEMLISVSGIGPKGALGILNVAPVDHLKEAIAMGDTGALTKVSGIGSKSAQKIILELRDKLGWQESEAGGTMLGDERDAIEGLVALGYAERSAREALKKVPSDTKGTGARIKEALKLLGK